MPGAPLARELDLPGACWIYLDTVRARVSAELAEGPRGGGRDRDQIVRHVLGVEQDWAREVGVRTPEGARVIASGTDLTTSRSAYRAAVEAFRAQGNPPRNWPLRFLVRHSAYHTMDRAWEREDLRSAAGLSPAGAGGVTRTL